MLLRTKLILLINVIHTFVKSLTYVTNYYKLYIIYKENSFAFSFLSFEKFRNFSFRNSGERAVAMSHG